MDEDLIKRRMQRLNSSRDLSRVNKLSGSLKELFNGSAKEWVNFAGMGRWPLITAVNIFLSENPEKIDAIHHAVKTIDTIEGKEIYFEAPESLGGGVMVDPYLFCVSMTKQGLKLSVELWPMIIELGRVQEIEIAKWKEEIAEREELGAENKWLEEKAEKAEKELAAFQQTLGVKAGRPKFPDEEPLKKAIINLSSQKQSPPKKDVPFHPNIIASFARGKELLITKDTARKEYKEITGWALSTIEERVRRYYK